MTRGQRGGDRGLRKGVLELLWVDVSREQERQEDQDRLKVLEECSRINPIWRLFLRTMICECES